VARHKDAFLVNLWFESAGERDARAVEWRGCVQHLMTQERRYFTDVGELVSFLTAYGHKDASAERDER
jgi:hypothetical protein